MVILYRSYIIHTITTTLRGPLTKPEHIGATGIFPTMSTPAKALTPDELMTKKRAAVARTLEWRARRAAAGLPTRSDRGVRLTPLHLRKLTPVQARMLRAFNRCWGFRNPPGTPAASLYFPSVSDIVGNLEPRGQAVRPTHYNAIFRLVQRRHLIHHIAEYPRLIHGMSRQWHSFSPFDRTHLPQ